MNRLLSLGCMLIASLGLFNACEKDIMSYEQDARAYFYERANDLNKTRINSRKYTFLTLPQSLDRDTVYIKVKIMGDTAAYDRYVIGKVIEEGSTAVEGEDFNFIPGLVPAGSVEGNLAVVLYRTPKLKSTNVQLNIAIGDSKDFKSGITEDSSFTLSWADKLQQPDNWPLWYFGAYSDTKYQFVLDELKIADFPSQLSPRLETQPGEFSIADLQNFASILRARLREVNEANAGKPNYPLKDENGVLITF